MSEQGTVSRARLEIQLEGYWHAGTGQGGGPGADARVALTPAGLPYLSGRSIKGLLREALRTAVEVNRPGLSDAQVQDWFGSDLRRLRSEGSSSEDKRDKRDEPDGASIQEEVRFNTIEGEVRFSNATLGADDAQAAAWEAWAKENARKASLVRIELANTRISGDSIAADETLRLIEVAAPLTLYAHIEGPAEALEAIGACCHLVRSVGAHRTRGLGRATVTLKRGA